ncbi:MAG: tetratricopeptide repeat protein [Chloracidobacterium sp.]|nr:tetratricopeptide repeat protein [Chloracidobacterium sp.]
MFGINAVRFAVFTGTLALTAMAVTGQDLGSSNKLFGGGSTKKAPAKSTTRSSKPKPVVTKKRSSARRTATAAKAAKPTPKTSQKPTKKPSTPTKTTAPDESWAWQDEIRPAEPPAQPTVTGNAANDLFEDLIEEGKRARDDRNYEAAEAAYRKARPLKPRDSRAIYGLGNLFSDQQRWAEAEAAYREALQIEAGFATTHIALSYVLTQPIPAENLSERYEEAERLARKAIQYAPSNALAHDQLGVAMELRGLISDETENAYRRAIQLDPGFAPAYAHLGRLLRRQGRTSESSAAYAEAVRLANDEPTMVLVAEVMQSEQRFAESEKLLSRAIANDPRNTAALMLLGRALLALNDLDEAESVLKRSIAVSPNAFSANSLLASLYLRQGRLELAENALLQAARFVPVFERTTLGRQFEALGDAFLRSSNSRVAERNYKQAQALDPNNAGLATKLARTKQGS